MKKLFLAYLTLLLAPIHAKTQDPRQTITLRVSKNASTVADLLTTTMRGKTGFNMPLAPQFTERSFFELAPKEMSSYPMLYETASGTITTAAIVRFIKQMQINTTVLRDLARYNYILTEFNEAHETILDDCIEAHKIWYADPSDENLASLQDAEAKGFNYLKTLDLRKQHIRKFVEDALSTPVTPLPKWNNAKAFASFDFQTHQITAWSLRPKNFTSFISKKLKEGLPIAFGMAALQYFVVAPMLAPRLAPMHQPDERGLRFVRKFATYATFALFGGLIASIHLLNWATEDFTTPEPGDGIKVKIEFDEGESCDASGDGGSHSEGTTQ